MKSKYSLKKKEIIKGKKSFEKVLSSDKRFKIGHLKVFVYHGSRRKVGFVVSSKVRKAVVRNRIKRWLREIYRKEKHMFKNNAEMIILIDRFDSKMTYNTLREDVLNILRDVNENA